MSRFQYEDVLERLAESFTILSKYQDKAWSKHFTVSVRGEPLDPAEEIEVHICSSLIEFDDLMRLEKLGWKHSDHDHIIWFDLFKTVK